MSKVIANTTLAVLAGGEGSRMGKAKGLLVINGRPILEHILLAVHWDGPTVLITSPGREKPPGAHLFDAEVLDCVAGQGPMRGVLTALQHANTEGIVVMPVDMPVIGRAPLRFLAERFAEVPDAMALMLRRQNQFEPLPAAFRKSAISAMERRLAEGMGSLRQLVECANVRTIEAPDIWEDSVWMNLNYPGDLEQLERDQQGH